MNRHTTSKSFSISSRAQLRLIFFLALFGLVINIAPLHAADVTWDNGAANLTWDTSSLNWSGSLWNNANGDGAIFSSAAGAIDVNTPINVNSLSFTANGFTLNGTGPLTFVSGSSTLG